MSLIDPTNPARWADGAPRSQNNCFTQAFDGEPIDWAGFQARAKMSASSTRSVARTRAGGKDPARLYGLSRKSDEKLNEAAKRYSPAIEGREAGQQAMHKRDALKRSRI